MAPTMRSCSLNSPVVSSSVNGDDQRSLEGRCVSPLAQEDLSQPAFRCASRARCLMLAGSAALWSIRKPSTKEGSESTAEEAGSLQTRTGWYVGLSVKYTSSNRIGPSARQAVVESAGIEWFATELGILSRSPERLRGLST